ncbi:response regulator transcription factor [Clostridium sp. M14]|uniref:response regulator transcription factor n=1 Tax=Clostridium sp. M14 TaxID=2716311 RepID=UPI0013EE6250|nr:response regulator transcription factor [Clostridium sp. M14]MBZ9693460.1 response regulator transcription factor [Clostridium sp. M14]
MKILLVEDEQRLSQVIQKGLKKLCYAVDVAFDGEEALEMIEINFYDLIILDLNIPKINGLKVLEKTRETNNHIKILILSAKNTIEDKITGLDLGANDYLEKPFDFLELAARISNLLRWKFISENTIITCGVLKIDTASKSALLKDNVIQLTNKEYAILEYLALNMDRFVSTEEIIEHVWDSDVDPFSNTFKYHIHSLKKKIGSDNIINARGRGYKLCEVNYEA